MKEYKKPAMMALSLSSNDALCSGSCSYGTRAHKDELEFLRWIEKVRWDDSNNDGVIGPGESNVFAEVGGDCEYGYGSYCKFTASAEGYGTVFTS